MREYTFEDWEEGIPIPYKFFSLDDEELAPERYMLWKKIFEAKMYVFNYLKDDRIWEELDTIKEDLAKIESLNDKRYYLNDCISKNKKIVEKIGRLKIILKPNSENLSFVSGKLYRAIKDQYENKEVVRSLGIGNEFLEGSVAHQLSSILEKMLLELSEDDLNKKSSFFEDVQEENNKKEPAAVRYVLLDLVFDFKEDEKHLNVGQKEKLLGYILGVRGDTAKQIKNGNSRYINKNHEARAKELLKKIKKGDIM